ncbi:hypothetical protein [Streptomyces spirodelae]|uniref:DUF3558 domain-containing protein n=1 Tax=Streptomyces spirodelae TaxID=2812904 RepID=A0ABS3WTY6_9ACTN|nr:hypothetical protein [Streptomyces spirodelae]MBO8186600.1 hypothetical protein [Streptomyces spirodelae]
MALLSYALVSEEDGGASARFDSAEADCSSVTGTSNAAELRRIVPDASFYSVKAERLIKERAAKLLCEVRADDRVAVRFLVKETAGDRDDWARYITQTDIDWSSGRHKVDVYGGGFSDAHAAALFLPCPGRAEAMGANQGMSLTVTAPPDGDHEKDLLQLAKRTAKYASQQLGCQK